MVDQPPDRLTNIVISDEPYCSSWRFLSDPGASVVLLYLFIQNEERRTVNGPLVEIVLSTDVSKVEL